ncbi:hypothetical protein BDW62DRAFT_205957 [Aspergillus aurantiobrunneus]
MQLHLRRDEVGLGPRAAVRRSHDRGCLHGLSPDQLGLGAVTYSIGAANGVSASYDAIHDLMSKEVDFPTQFDPTTDGLIAAAAFGDLEKTGLWYRRCAMALRQLGHVDEAIEYFSRALELDGNDYLTRETVGIISSQIDHDPEEQLPKVHIHLVLERMARCYKELGDREARLDTVERAYENSSGYFRACINDLLNEYGASNDHEAFIRLLKQLADTPHLDRTRLTQALWDVTGLYGGLVDLVANAATATDDLHFVVQAWRTAAKGARMALKTVTAAMLDLGLAHIYSRYLHDGTKAAKLGEKILNTYASSQDDSVISHIMVQASYLLAEQLLQDIVDAGIGTPESEMVGARLERVAKRSTTDRYDSMCHLDSMRHIALGIYYRLAGRDAEARAQFQPVVKRGIQILSDDDPGNDCHGFYSLFRVLAATGDVKNVIATAYALDKACEERSEVNLWTCFGACGKELKIIQGSAVCLNCLDIVFCQHCAKLLEGGTAIDKRCSASHVKDFIYIPPPPRDLEKGTMLVDGEAMDFED